MANIDITYNSTFGDNSIFAYPLKSCILENELYICDRQNNKIQVYLPSPELVFQREFGIGEISLPEDITTDGLHLYVADLGNNRIAKYSKTGVLDSYISTGVYAQINCIEHGASHLYFVSKNTVVKINLTGTVIDTFGGDGIFNFPRGIHYENGIIYVADTYNARIVTYTEEGDYIQQYFNTEIKRPSDIQAVDDFILVTDLTQGKLHALNKTDLELNKSVGFFGSGINNFNFPTGIVAASETVLFISDTANHRIQTYNYEVSEAIDYAVDVSIAAMNLYPTGQWFDLSLNSNIRKLNNGISLFFSRAWDSIKEIGYWILPDNDRFDAEAIGLWENVFGIPENTNKSLNERRDTITQRMQFPGEILARQSRGYIENQLRVAGFDVYVTLNRFPASDVISESGSESMEMGAETADMNYSGPSSFRFERREPEVGYTELIANNIKSDADINIFEVDIYNESGGESMEMGGAKADMAGETVLNREHQLRGTFFVHGSTYPALASVPLIRKKEFRELILKLKPAQMVGFLYINYV